MKREGEYITLISGRRLYVFAGVLGLLDNREVGAGDQLVYGYDGHVDNTMEVPTLTSKERKEIAGYMITRWAKWADVGTHCIHIGCGGIVRFGEGTCTWCGR